MSLINCPECGRSVSSEADKCPKCGFGVANWHKAKLSHKPKDFRRNDIKSFLVVGAALAIAGVFGLGKNTFTDNTESKVEQNVNRQPALDETDGACSRQLPKVFYVKQGSYNLRVSPSVTSKKVVAHSDIIGDSSPTISPEFTVTEYCRDGDWSWVRANEDHLKSQYKGWVISKALWQDDKGDPVNPPDPTWLGMDQVQASNACTEELRGRATNKSSFSQNWVDGNDEFITSSGDLVINKGFSVKNDFNSTLEFSGQCIFTKDGKVKVRISRE